MNSSSAFHLSVKILGSQYGPIARFFNAVAAAYLNVFVSLFGYCLSSIYFLGPIIPFTGIGFWESRSIIDICSQTSRLPPEYWLRNENECNALVFGLFENFAYSLASLHWSIILLYVIYWVYGVARNTTQKIFHSVLGLPHGRVQRHRGNGRLLEDAALPALAYEMAPEPVGADGERLLVDYAVKVKHPVRDFGSADGVVED